MIDWFYTARCALAWGAIFVPLGWLLICWMGFDQVFDTIADWCIAALIWVVICAVISGGFALAFCVVGWANA